MKICIANVAIAIACLLLPAAVSMPSDGTPLVADHATVARSLMPSLRLAAATADRSSHPGLKKGSVAPNFTVQNPTGKPVKLSNYTEKVVVIDFWTIGCVPLFSLSWTKLERLRLPMSVMGARQPAWKMP